VATSSEEVCSAKKKRKGKEKCRDCASCPAKVESSGECGKQLLSPMFGKGGEESLIAPISPYIDCWQWRKDSNLLKAGSSLIFSRQRIRERRGEEEQRYIYRCMEKKGF